MKLKLVLLCLSAVAATQVTAQSAAVDSNKSPVFNLTGIGTNAVGKRKIIISAAINRVGKLKNPPVCPVFNDMELEALIVDFKDSKALRERYSAMSADASTLGNHTNMTTMNACEKQARRIMFYWDNRSIEGAQIKYDLRVSKSY